MELNREKYWCQIFNLLNNHILFNSRLAGFCSIFRILFFLFLIVHTTTLSAQTFNEVDIKDIKDLIVQVQKFRNSYTNYQVGFKEIRGRKVLIGQLYFAKPNYLRITYYRGKNPVTEVYLGDDKLIVYFITSDIVYEQENFNSSQQETPNVVGSLDYLLENYNFNFKSSKELVSVFNDDDYKKFNLIKNPNQFAYHLNLTPKNVTERLDNLEIWIASAADNENEYVPDQIIRSRSISVNGSISDIYFSPIKINQRLPADVFSFVVPAHVRIVKNFFPNLDL